MPTEMRLWRIEKEKPSRIEQEKLNLEERLENWMLSDVGLFEQELLVIGHQVNTVSGPLDVLAVDREGNLVILELKRDKTPRDVVAQTLDYASWVNELDFEYIQRIANEYLKPRTLEQAFKDKFESELPDSLNEHHRMYIIASRLDSATERIIEYLSEEHNVDINAVTFAYFKTADGEYLGRSVLLDEEQVQERAARTSRRKPNLTPEQMRGLAEERGVVELYDLVLKELDPLIDGISPTRSNMALNGIMGPTGSRNRLIGIWPGLSSSKDGLVLVVDVKRVCEYFGIEGRTLKELIGTPLPNTATYNPDTYLLNEQRLRALVDSLKGAAGSKKQSGVGRDTSPISGSRDKVT